jgi:hypothetical protein
MLEFFVYKKLFGDVLLALKNILNGVSSKNEPPLKSSQTSQPGLRSCLLATVLKSALQRVAQK